MKWTRYIAVSALVIATGTLQGCGPDPSAKKDAVPFDRAVWVANQGVRDDSNARRAMLASAAALLKPGLSHADVRKLLGDPDNESETRWAYVVVLARSSNMKWTFSWCCSAPEKSPSLASRLPADANFVGRS